MSSIVFCTDEIFRVLAGEMHFSFVVTTSYTYLNDQPSRAGVIAPLGHKNSTKSNRNMK